MEIVTQAHGQESHRHDSRDEGQASAQLTGEGFLCRVCGQRHVLSLSYSVKAPLAAAAIPPDELEARVVLTAEQCVIDQKTYFLRGRIPVPICVPEGMGPSGVFEQPFIWGVWAEISPKNFLRTQQLWNTPGREAEPPFAGYLNTELPLYGKTIDLQVDIHTQPVGRRPHFFIHDSAHPLAVEQREGITLERMERIAEQVLHPELTGSRE